MTYFIVHGFCNDKIAVLAYLLIITISIIQSTTQLITVYAMIACEIMCLMRYKHLSNLITLPESQSGGEIHRFFIIASLKNLK